MKNGTHIDDSATMNDIKTYFVDKQNKTDIAGYQNSTGYSYSDSNHHYEISRWINTITYPVLIILGTVGNVLTFVVMQRGSLRNVPTCFYMAILALADTGE